MEGFRYIAWYKGTDASNNPQYLFSTANYEFDQAEFLQRAAGLVHANPSFYIIVTAPESYQPPPFMSQTEFEAAPFKLVIMDDIEGV